MASSVPVTTGTGTGADEKAYTLESLKEHSSRESLWMLLHDKVYDVTRFMDEVSGRSVSAHWAGLGWGVIAMRGGGVTRVDRLGFVGW
jgi:hypothetical protein